MLFTYFDSSMILLIPAILLAIWAQLYVKSTFKKYNQIPSHTGYTGMELARKLIADFNLRDVDVEIVQGNLTDHYDPRSKILRLSQAIASSRSVAALGVAAHEVGHAVQHQKAYSPFQLRQTIFPVANLGSTLAFPLIFAGLIFSFKNLLDIGIVFFSAAVLFQIVTLPVEFNASSRAITVLKNRGYLAETEISDAKKVLNAAALTYVAAAAVSVLQLLRLLVLRNSRD